MLVTPIYVAALAVILVALSIRVIRLRRKFGVAIGHGNEAELERAMRVHANFCEYVPVAVILVYFVEISLGTGWWAHVLGASLLLARCLHGFGVSQVRENLRLRVIGMATTFTVILASAIVILLVNTGLVSLA